MMTTTLFTATLVRADQIRTFLIRLARPGGWEATVYDDLRIIQRHLYTDWHRVEQAITILTLQIAQLHKEGWHDAGATRV
jgi:hypothetical protein